MPTLSEQALLCTLQISQWTARKLDKTETVALNRSHGLNVEAARVNKNLLPFGVALERVHAITGQIRKDFTKRTLPWGIDGMNILKATAYLDFITTVRDWKVEWQAAVDEFVTTYPQAVREAEVLLNTLFKPEDYPEPETIRDRFRFDVRFMPVPDQQDWRIDVGDAERARLAEAITAQVTEAEGRAVREAWQRVYDVVSRARERLAIPENVFRDTLVENAQELCALLPSLNVTDDPALERARQDIEGSLCRYTPDDLRNNPVVREDVAEKMADVMARMAGFMNA